jgi:hypothetical protein
MNISLERSHIGSDGAFGRFFDVNDRHVCFTLEHAYLNADGTYSVKLPPGKYTCKRRMSPHFKYELFQILGVPGHDFIEIHKGNFNNDSDGCVLLGENVKPQFNGDLMLINSAVAFDAFMDLQHDVDEFELTVNPPNEMSV